LRQVQVEDLLGREPAELDLNLISSYIRGKARLVTGAGGSIGSELCRQILRFAPAEIHLLGPRRKQHLRDPQRAAPDGRLSRGSSRSSAT
jgi:FlaA1/EpsC-like NDP-sugar epimerase